MKIWLVCSLAVGSLYSFATPQTNQEKATNLVLLEKSILTLEGDSTLHAFTSQTSTFTLVATLSNKTPPSSAIWEKITSQKALTSLTLSIPISSLHSETSGLDENLYKEIKADKFPEIIFTIRSYEFNPPHAGTSTLVFKGELTIAGTTKRVEITTDATLAEDIMQVKGKTELIMSDFNITPPTIMFGMIKVADKITINFDMYLALRP